jgi:hypothetical protein
MMLKRRAVRGRQRRTVPVKVPHQIPFAVAAHPVAQNVVVHPPAHVERIDLDVPVVHQGGADIRVGLIQR